MAPCGTLASPANNCKDSASKRRRTNRLAKLKQCKLEAPKEQWLFHQGAEQSQGQEILHEDDPGEVIHPEPKETKTSLSRNSTITWASLLHSDICAHMHRNPQRMQPTSRLSLSSESEPDPDLLHVNSYIQVNSAIKRTEQKGLCRDSRSGFSSDRCANTDASPKSCEDRCPKGKASKVGRGPRRARGRCRNSKENMRFDNQVISGQQRRLGELCHGQEHAENGWEAATDALGLHTIQKKNFTNVLQPQAPLLNDQRRSRITSAPLLGLKPNKHQHNAHGRAWIQGDLRRSNFSTGPAKQQNSGSDMQSLRKLDVSEKPQCLICTEYLDITDTSFEGCKCGFNICLFCYHTIAQETGRCPGCRGDYKRDVAAKPACLLPR
ncbi:hypothetical protein L7F22_057286 [Adiantum nelumboides]|nr:hypothetical protein [Adiantum nelumboides]